MHDLNTLTHRNTQHVYDTMRAALAEDSAAGYARARRIAKANPDLFVQDGRVRVPTRDPDDAYDAYCEMLDTMAEEMTRAEYVDEGGEG